MNRFTKHRWKQRLHAALPTITAITAGVFIMWHGWKQHVLHGGEAAALYYIIAGLLVMAGAGYELGNHYR